MALIIITQLVNQQRYLSFIH